MSTLTPDIEGFLLQLESINQDFPGLVAGLSQPAFNWSAAPGRWSIGQCIEHLNITTERYLPVINTAIAGARSAGRVRQGPFVLGVLERAFYGVLEPPVSFRVKAPKPFVAVNELSPEATVERWNRLQGQFADCLRSADGLDLAGIKVRSQFGPVSFSLNGTFLILLAHERRHLWQAREVRTAAAFPG